MQVRDFYMHLLGYVNITVEGFFVERFINNCFAKGIFLWNLEREKSTYLKARISSRDFKKIRKIARNTKCKVKINSKKGLPILINRYKKRKIFFAFLVMIIIGIFILTRFIWNIDVVGNKNISSEDIMELLRQNDIKVGMLRKKVDKEKIINEIRMERNDISWIGIDIEGTNLKVSISESDLAPEVEDPNEVCNIISDKDGEIAKIIVQNGTARVNVGDFVKKGDLLVEGIMEGKYTGIRNVHSEADIYGENSYTKERKENFVQNDTIKSGKQEKKYDICKNCI